MSLSISFHAKVSINTDIFNSEINEERNAVFGAESFRRALWGHPIIKILDCRLIYSLNMFDLCVFDDELTELKNELEIILNKIDLIVNITGFDKEGIEFRVLNALEHVRIAEKYKDQIGIYIG